MLGTETHAKARQQHATSELATYPGTLPFVRQLLIEAHFWNLTQRTGQPGPEDFAVMRGVFTCLRDAGFRLFAHTLNKQGRWPVFPNGLQLPCCVELSFLGPMYSADGSADVDIDPYNDNAAGDDAAADLHGGGGSGDDEDEQRDNHGRD